MHDLRGRCGIRVKYVPEIHHRALQRASGDAAASLAGGLETVAVVRDFLALAAHAGVAAIEDGAGLGAGCPSSPVPILYS